MEAEIRELYAAAAISRGVAETRIAGATDREIERLGITDEVGQDANSWRRTLGVALREAVSNDKLHVSKWLAAKLPHLKEEHRMALVAHLSNTHSNDETLAGALTALPHAALASTIEWLEQDERIGEDIMPLATRVVGLFGKKTPAWAARFDSLAGAGKAHDGAHWLPSGGTSDLAEYMLRVPLNLQEPVITRKRLENVVRNWEVLAEQVATERAGERTPSLSELNLILVARPRRVAADSGYAEAWKDILGASDEEYEKALIAFSASAGVPRAPLPRAAIRSGELTGIFLDRTDPGGLTLGARTVCCQRIGDFGEFSALHGQTQQSGGFFCVTDKSGKVLAQSWVWVGEDGACFDNIELADYDNESVGEGMRERMKAVAVVYEAAAEALAVRFSKVTVGSGYTNKGLVARYPATKHKITGLTWLDSVSPGLAIYSDAGSKQRTLAQRKQKQDWTWDGRELRTKEGNLVATVSAAPGPGGAPVMTAILASGFTPEDKIAGGDVAGFLHDISGDLGLTIFSSRGELLDSWEDVVDFEKLLGTQWRSLLEIGSLVRKYPAIDLDRIHGLLVASFTQNVELKTVVAWATSGKGDIGTLLELSVGLVAGGHTTLEELIKLEPDADALCSLLAGHIRSIDELNTLHETLKLSRLVIDELLGRLSPTVTAELIRYNLDARNPQGRSETIIKYWGRLGDGEKMSLLQEVGLQGALWEKGSAADGILIPDMERLLGISWQKTVNEAESLTSRMRLPRPLAEALATACTFGNIDTFALAGWGANTAGGTRLLEDALELAEAGLINLKDVPHLPASKDGLYKAAAGAVGEPKDLKRIEQVGSWKQGVRAERDGADDRLILAVFAHCGQEVRAALILEAFKARPSWLRPTGVWPLLTKTQKSAALQDEETWLFIRDYASHRGQARLNFLESDLGLFWGENWSEAADTKAFIRVGKFDSYEATVERNISILCKDAGVSPGRFIDWVGEAKGEAVAVSICVEDLVYSGVATLEEALNTSPSEAELVGLSARNAAKLSDEEFDSMAEKFPRLALRSLPARMTPGRFSTTLRKAPSEALRFALDEMTDAQVAEAVSRNYTAGLRYAHHRMSDAQFNYAVVEDPETALLYARARMTKMQRARAAAACEAKNVQGGTFEAAVTARPLRLLLARVKGHSVEPETSIA